MRIALTVWMAVCALLALPALAQEANESPIAIRAYTNRTSYSLGEPVQFYLTLENISDSEVEFSANLAMDKGLEVTVTPAYQVPRRFIDRESGWVLPNVVKLDSGGIRGIYQHVHHSTLDGGSMAFPEAGMYRLDFSMIIEVTQADGSKRASRVISPPVNIQIFEPLDETAAEAAEIMQIPTVARSVQLRNPTDASIAHLERLLEIAPDSEFAEHANFLLGLHHTVEKRWVEANRYFYEVYETENWFYPKDIVLLSILTNYHWDDEPERALQVCVILLDLYPAMRERSHPIVDTYHQIIRQHLTNQAQG